MTHIHMHNLNKLASRNLFEGLPTLKFENDWVCKACHRRKQTENLFRNKNFVSISRPIEELHKDLFGPSRTMSQGSNYYGLVIVDDFSRFTWTLFRVSKDDVFNAFNKLAKVLQNEKNCCIFVIKTYHRGEFQNKRFIKFCEKFAIKHHSQLIELHIKIEWWRGKIGQWRNWQELF